MYTHAHIEKACAHPYAYIIVQQEDIPLYERFKRRTWKTYNKNIGMKLENKLNSDVQFSILNINMKIVGV